MAHKLPMTHEPVFEQLGESQVRMQFVGYSDEIGVQAREWLRLKEQSRADDAATKRDEREEATLSIARDANRIASAALSSSRRANKIAISAIVFASATTIIAAIIGVMYASTK